MPGSASSGKRGPWLRSRTRTSSRSTTSATKGAACSRTELLEGETLRERLGKGPLPSRRAVETGGEIAEGLAAAHARGLVHRDLKPGNVFLTSDGRVKLLDFGLAKLSAPADPEAATEAATLPGTVLGTAGYMAPEQVAGKAVDSRADIFALGCVLYEMMAGARAFARATVPESLTAILHDEPPPLASAAPQAPPELAQLVSHCLAKDPGARFQSAQDVAFALRFVAGAPASGPLPRAPAGPRFSKGGMAVAASALLATVVATTLLTRSSAPLPQPSALVQLTHGEGYTAQPSISADGALVAYASDRAGAGNLDIWVHHMGGGDPIQVTSDPADERQPAFSPDGARLAFRSEREPGGLYTMPVLGGEPRLLVEGGFNPRYSPDGRWIAYWKGPFVGFATATGSYRTFVVAASGGAPREITGFTGVRFPTWSADSKWLLVVASRTDPPDHPSYDWWSVPLEGGGDAVPSLSVPRLKSEEAWVDYDARPAGWLGDEIVVGAGRDAWAVGLRPGGQASHARRLTFGPGRVQHPAVSAAGLVAFAAPASTQGIWALPLDVESGKALAEPRRIADGRRATFSADGKTMAYLAGGSDPLVLVKDLESGRVRELGIRGNFGPVLSRDGSRLANPDLAGNGVVVRVRGGEPRELCTNCMVGDWLSDNRSVTTVEGPGSGTVLRLVDTDSGARRDLIRVSEGIVNRPHVSADDRWLAFRLTEGEGHQSVFVAPLRPGAPPDRSEWVRVGDPEADLRPCGWSPSGRMLYLVSSRDGFRCVYAQPMDPATGRPRGAALLVRHLHNVRAPGGDGASIVSTGAGNAVVGGQLIIDFPIESANVWTMTLGAARPAPPVGVRP